MKRQITFIILILAIFSMRAWAEDASTAAYDFLRDVLFTGFIFFIAALFVGKSVTDNSPRGGTLVMLAAILGMLVIITAAILGNLDGLANILDKIPFFH